jgi:hypothetical protein
MERGQSLTPGLQWLWPSFGTGALGLAGALLHIPGFCSEAPIENLAQRLDPNALGELDL